MTPEEFISSGPQKPDDLIGKARTVAQLFVAKIRSGVISPIKLLCYGQPGVGKSATCKIIAQAMVIHPSDIRHVSAKELTAEHLRNWMSDLMYINDQWRVYLIEEVDAVNNEVGGLLLHFLDKLPQMNAVLVTSNEKMTGIEDRFQSRFKAIKFEKPSVDEVAKFLRDRWPEIGDTAMDIAKDNDGDVRASLNDAQLELDVQRYKGEMK